MIREAFQQAADFFVSTVAEVDTTQWEQPGLGVWTVRDLVGHTSRALLTVEAYLDKSASRVDMERPVDYFLRAMASLANPGAVAERGREAGRALGADPVGTVRRTAMRVVERLAQVADDTLVDTPVGAMRLIDYLPTRVFELTIHTLDLATALAIEVSIPDRAAKITMALVAELALQPGKTIPLLMAATGRSSLPGGYNVL